MVKICFISLLAFTKEIENAGDSCLLMQTEHLGEFRSLKYTCKPLHAAQVHLRNIQILPNFIVFAAAN